MYLSQYIEECHIFMQNYDHPVSLLIVNVKNGICICITLFQKCQQSICQLF